MQKIKLVGRNSHQIRAINAAMRIFAEEGVTVTTTKSTVTLEAEDTAAFRRWVHGAHRALLADQGGHKLGGNYAAFHATFRRVIEECEHREGAYKAVAK